MSPEINGNPPSAVKRKKNRDKKQSRLNDLNIPTSDYLSSNQMGYNNSFDLSIPDLSQYYSVLNFSNGSEPLSLPIHPTNYSNYNQTRLGGFPNISTPKNLHCPPNNNDVGDYMSLPVTNLDLDMDENGKRRYSDPGVPNDDSDSSVNSLEEKVIKKLLVQVNVLKNCNQWLSKEVMEMRSELNMLKQQVQQQNKRHFDREYEPGMLADVIREVRDAARVREDALLAKVKYIMEEKQMNMNHLQLISERNRNMDRIAKLEKQLRNITINPEIENQLSAAKPSIEDGHSARQVLELEREALELRRELQDTRAKKEEADQKVVILNKKLASISKRNDVSASDVSENGKTDSTDSVSMTTTSSIIHGISTGVIPRVTLSGPVTDL
ncbi:uncharacterized protein LOC123675469 isoform X1 [Harmonia axyridis]|uniref:uncharacterized protein LOC123675469 isoform X1 n=1 Tax=Harmonia axyridis TaxID=115357 RepID=UPI001E27703E|nr:uncharacterized protein LOC123675469 isoform X1 [Harmonia axyridis]